jgi:hypothetical protein
MLKSGVSLAGEPAQNFPVILPGIDGHRNLHQTILAEYAQQSHVCYFQPRAATIVATAHGHAAVPIQ